MITFAKQFLEETIQVAQQLDYAAIERIVEVIASARANGGRVFFIGVGGGAAHASHAVCDFRKLCGLECYAPTDNIAELTARTNDDGWESVLTEWLKGSHLRGEDVVCVLSVGGGDAERNISVNIIDAAIYALENGASVVGIVGKPDGWTATHADECVVVPTVNSQHRTAHTEAFQSVILHLLAFHPLLQQHPAKWESTR